jgi:hypothetical protein
MPAARTPAARRLARTPVELTLQHSSAIPLTAGGAADDREVWQDAEQQEHDERPVDQQTDRAADPRNVTDRVGPVGTSTRDERRGVLPPPRRRPFGYGEYTPGTIERI